MKKKILIATITLSLFAFPAISLAQTQGTGSQQRIQDPATHKDGTPAAAQGNTVQNQNQASTQNKGVASQLQVANQQMIKLMDMSGLNEEAGAQVKQLAQAQSLAQGEIGGQLDKLGTRQGLMKTLLGPDYGTLKSLKELYEQNQVRIQQLEQLQNQLENEADQTQIQEATQALIEQNTALQEQILIEENVSSLFGWLIKLFSY